MKYLVTGGGGYIGTVLVDELLAAGHEVDVFDRFYFGEEPFGIHKGNPKLRLVRGDIRSIDVDVVRGHDVVLDLAGMSNDPSADLDPRLTEEINYAGSIRLAQLARGAGVPRLVYSSSCSIYGAAGSGDARDEEAELNPVSLYAKMKVKSDLELRAMASPNFVVTTMRNATVYGLSRRMRFDLVVNMMTLFAWRDKKIFVMGGGKQWRPLVHVKDVAQAFMLAANAPAEKVNGEAFNIGFDEQTYQVTAIASMVAGIVPNTEIEHVPDDPDKRSYRVNFGKAKRVLGLLPKITVEAGAKEVLDALMKSSVDDNIKTKTVAYYRFLIEAERLVNQLSINGRVL
ncbi:MAG: SDR family oxidoreductase [Polyangiaceae bacterium]